ncbi:MAG: hypothetical protein B6U72_01855 [Candidatus Altiarchaeales archaeon ex4484_2]|nr:MAG: hypothetical protein B6U72_01855 [Candidatus Altiarchaeales archaeon ex4484_2]
MKQIPCIVFLPEDREERINMLQSIFGSEVKMEILKQFCTETGVKKKIYQHDLIEDMNYSNKTIITHVKDLVGLGILREGMEKKRNWRKHLEVKENMEWLILLLHDPGKLEEEKLRDSIEKFSTLYLKHLKSLVKQYGIDERHLL